MSNDEIKKKLDELRGKLASLQLQETIVKELIGSIVKQCKHTDLKSYGDFDQCQICSTHINLL